MALVSKDDLFPWSGQCLYGTKIPKGSTDYHACCLQSKEFCSLFLELVDGFVLAIEVITNLCI